MVKPVFNKRKIAVLCSIISLALFLNISGIYAEYKSGYFVILCPSYDSIERDFSELVDSCSTFNGLDTCVVVSADILFPVKSGRPDSVCAVVGILDLGEFDSSGLENLDTVPTTGYSDYIIVELNHIYAVKTTEDHYAALFYMYQYIGGICRLGFKWAYQSSGTNNLSQNVDVKWDNQVNTLQNNYHIKIVPSSKGLKISWSPFTENVCFEIYNSSGQMLDFIQEEGRNGGCISNIYLPKGIYFVKSNLTSKILSAVIF